VERSRRVYTEVLGGTVVFGPEPTNIALASAFIIIIINVGGGPTDDKPTVTLETPRDLTPPKQHEYEIRCYIRDPDGHIIEVGQTTEPQGDWSRANGPPITSGGQSG
jgi:hypothetical protein